MSPFEKSITFDKFCRMVYDAATSEPYATRFNELSRKGNRRAMIELIMGIGDVSGAELAELYRGKNNAQAGELYETSMRMLAEKSDRCDDEIKACDVLTEALFAAGARSRVFFDALLERAKRWYIFGAYTKCLKDCKCMLALPTRFHETSADSGEYFSERRQECLRLERECSRRLEVLSCRRKQHGKRPTKRNADYNETPTRKRSSTPTVDGKRHGWLVSCSDAVTFRYDEKNGRHLVTTKDVKTGTVLIVDKPFSFSTDVEALNRNCLHCHASLKSEDSVRLPCRNCQTVSFCSESCRMEAWRLYHRYECTVFDHFFQNGCKQRLRQSSHLLLAYRMTVLKALPLDDRELDDNNGTTDAQHPVFDADFLRRHGSELIEGTEQDRTTSSIDSAEFGPKNKYSPSDYRTVLRLETHCTDADPSKNLIRTIEAIFLTKCLTFSLGVAGRDSSLFVTLAVGMLHHLQAINCNAYEIIENVRNETTRVWEPRNVGGAIYTTVSLVNHSCYPNTVRHSYPNGTVVVRAIRFIPKGTEVLDCYGPSFLTEERLARREFLWKKYRFMCACVACTHNWQSPLPDTIQFGCSMCMASNCVESANADTGKEAVKMCGNCRQKIDVPKLSKQFQKSVQKRQNAIGKMYQGDYEEALPLLLEHAYFVEKYLIAPSIEAIKTQQCIIQCYNSLGCTAVQ